MMPWTSSGSRRSDIAVKPETSENITVTIFRSPSSAPFEVKIFSARCFGVYVTGAASRKTGFVVGGGTTDEAAPAEADGVAADALAEGAAACVRRAPHSPQNFCFASFWLP